MKTRWLLWSVALLGALVVGGCTDDETPTAPISGLNVSGAWTGTITYYDSACAREGIAVTLTQNRSTVTGSFPTSCQGTLELRGATNADSLVGELYRELDGLQIGQISGTASRTRIQVTTWRPQPREERGEPPTRTVINVIDLER
jgi:hypothetical protein